MASERVELSGIGTRPSFKDENQTVIFGWMLCILGGESSFLKLASRE
jgi:hypothetical protein